jgi:molybdopterin-guanine dinucleotide biosynthesis protein A
MKNLKATSPLSPATTPCPLLVLAGGRGSRYGGLKQIDGIAPHEEAILDFSVFDALATGFNKFVLIINRSIPAAFTERLLAVLPRLRMSQI